MNEICEITPWGSCALVAYIPDPLRSVLDGLRQVLPGDHVPQPHITILPPRALKLPVQEASEQAEGILRRVLAFEIELAKVHYFPETNFLYLSVGAGDASLRRLHQALNSGLLHSGEEFEFRPHLTLGGPVPHAQLDSTQAQLQKAWQSAPCSRRFTLDELVFLWLKPDSQNGEWLRVSAHSLAKKESISATAAAVGLTSRTL